LKNPVTTSDLFLPRCYRVGFLLIIALFPCSIFFLVFDHLPESWDFANYAILWIYAAVVFMWSVLERGWPRALCDFGLIAAAAIGIEAVGVKTGVLFGAYYYTDVLGAQLWDVPIAIGLAWYVTAVGAFECARFVTGGKLKPGIYLSLIAALFVIALDLALEPFAVSIKSYWVWMNGSVPLLNYVSWFWISFLMVSYLSINSPQSAPKLFCAPIGVLCMQMVLFWLTDVKNAFLTPVIISFLVVSGILIISRRFRA